MKRAHLGLFVGVAIGLSACVTLLRPAGPDPLVRCPMPDAYAPWMEVITPPSEADWAGELDDLRSLGTNPYRSYAWLRTPANMHAAYTTCKAVGLERFVSVEDYWSPVKSWSEHPAYHGLSYDSMLTCYTRAYGRPGIQDHYYDAFWERRMAEGNASTVYTILMDIQNTYRGLTVEWEPEKELTDLRGLLEADLAFRDDTSADRHCTYARELEALNMHASARALLVKQAHAQQWSWCLDGLHDSLPYWTGTEQQHDSTACSNTHWLMPETYFHGP